MLWSGAEMAEDTATRPSDSRGPLGWEGLRSPRSWTLEAASAAEAGHRAASLAGWELGAQQPVVSTL